MTDPHAAGHPQEMEIVKAEKPRREIVCDSPNCPIEECVLIREAIALAEKGRSDE